MYCYATSIDSYKLLAELISSEQSSLSEVGSLLNTYCYATSVDFYKPLAELASAERSVL